MNKNLCLRERNMIILH